MGVTTVIFSYQQLYYLYIHVYVLVSIVKIYMQMFLCVMLLYVAKMSEFKALLLVAMLLCNCQLANMYNVLPTFISCCYVPVERI